MSFTFTYFIQSVLKDKLSCCSVNCHSETKNIMLQIHLTMSVFDKYDVNILLISLLGSRIIWSSPSNHQSMKDMTVLYRRDKVLANCSVRRKLPPALQIFHTFLQTNTSKFILLSIIKQLNSISLAPLLLEVDYLAMLFILQLMHMAGSLRQPKNKIAWPNKPILPMG